MSRVSDEQTDSKKFICWVHGNPLVWIMKACCSIINVCMRALCSCTSLACEGNFIIPNPMLFIRTWRTCTHTNHCNKPCQLKQQAKKKKKQAHNVYSQAQGTRVLLKPANKPARRAKHLNKVNTPAKLNLRSSPHLVVNKLRKTTVLFTHDGPGLFSNTIPQVGLQRLVNVIDDANYKHLSRWNFIVDTSLQRCRLRER